MVSSVPAPEGRSLIARGGGRSHGDGALNDGGAVALTERLDRMLSFDAQSGVLVAESGVTMGDILDTFLPRGHMLAVCPGDSRATVGGAIASDALGDNHVRAGAFGAHVLWIDLVTPRDGLRRVSRHDAADLFEATVGGLGLTGIIVRAALRLAPTASAFVAVRREAVGALDGLIVRLQEAAVMHDYATAWIDALGNGLAQGRGVLQVADRVGGGKRVWKPLARKGTPAVLPAMLAHLLPRRGLLRALDEQRYRRSAGRSATGRPLAVERLLFGPQRGSAWQRLYGCDPIVRLQCALPPDGAAAAVRRLLEIARRDGATTQAAACAMGDGVGGMLSIARPGIGLTLDLPGAKATPDLMHRLERETLDRGGRLFLAGDTRLTDHGFAAMYPRLDAFRAVLAQVDPDMRLQSDLARRLRLRDYVV
jgi:decaprenylphospho-beta-D-ribofuranose 2-oxidase